MSDKIKSESKAGMEFEKISDLTFPSSPSGKHGEWEGTLRVARFCFCNPVIKVVLVFMTIVFKSGLTQKAGINHATPALDFGLGFLFM